MACGKHTVSTDSIVLLHVRRIRNIYRITGVLRTPQSGGCAEFDFPPSLRTSAHTGVAIRAPTAVAIFLPFTFRLTRPSPLGKVAALVLTEEEKRDEPGRLGWFPDPHSPPHSLFRRHSSAPSPLGRFLGAPKDERTTKTIQLPTTNQAGYSLSANLFAAVGAARRAHGSSAKHAMRDLIASHAPLRNGSHKARQNGPKHYPRGFKGPPTGAPPKPNEVGLVGRGGATE